MILLKGLVSLFGLAVMLFAVVYLGIGGVNQLIDGLQAEPTNWSDTVWGIVRILLTTTVFGFGAVITVTALFADSDY